LLERPTADLLKQIAQQMGRRTVGKSLRQMARLMDLSEGAVKGLWQRMLIEARRRLCDPGL
jgi:DNA-binding CsgD family transcriptional regulator